MSTLLVGIGILIGLVVASDLGWLPFGHAVPEPTVQKEAPAAPPAPAPVSIGVDRNFVSIAKAVRPAVVNVFTTRTGKGGEGLHGMPFEDPFFRRFFGEEFFRRFEVPRERKERSLGSGVIVDSKGLIITNNHVVSKADEIKVLLSDKREFKAKLIGTDAKTDLAVLRIDAEGLHTIPWANSDKLEVGEFVLAVGTPFGLNQTVTLGIVSAVGRASMGIAEYEDFIQTDAAINPGNSGGALVNTRGELVGINTAIFSQSGGYQGIGFAIPSNLARRVVNDFLKYGEVRRGDIGYVEFAPLTTQDAAELGAPDARGVLVQRMRRDAPAFGAGLRPGDIVVSFNGTAVNDSGPLTRLIQDSTIGATAAVQVIRNGRRLQLKIPIVRATEQ